MLDSPEIENLPLSFHLTSTWRVRVRAYLRGLAPLAGVAMGILGQMLMRGRSSTITFEKELIRREVGGVVTDRPWTWVTEVVDDERYLESAETSAETSDVDLRGHRLGGQDRGRRAQGDDFFEDRSSHAVSRISTSVVSRGYWSMERHSSRGQKNPGAPDHENPDCVFPSFRGAARAGGCPRPDRATPCANAGSSPTRRGSRAAH